MTVDDGGYRWLMVVMMANDFGENGCKLVLDSGEQWLVIDG